LRVSDAWNKEPWVFACPLPDAAIFVFRSAGGLRASETSGISPACANVYSSAGGPGVSSVAEVTRIASLGRTPVRSAGGLPEKLIRSRRYVGAFHGRSSYTATPTGKLLRAGSAKRSTMSGGAGAGGDVLSRTYIKPDWAREAPPPDRRACLLNRVQTQRWSAIASVGSPPGSRRAEPRSETASNERRQARAAPAPSAGHIKSVRPVTPLHEEALTARDGASGGEEMLTANRRGNSFALPTMLRNLRAGERPRPASRPIEDLGSVFAARCAARRSPRRVVGNRAHSELAREKSREHRRSPSSR